VRAWLDATEALSFATARRDGEAASHALARAARAVHSDRRTEPPPWPWVFPFDHAKLAGYRALVAVRLTRPGDALAAFTESLSASQPAPKQRAAVQVHLAGIGHGSRDPQRMDGRQPNESAACDDSGQPADTLGGIVTAQHLACA
jgi:hypothetical protein